MEIEELWTRIEAAAPLESPPDVAPDWDDGAAERARLQTDRRRHFLALYAWCVPTREAVEVVATFAGERAILEVCAGNGLWARLIAAAGAKVVATDGEPRGDSEYHAVEALEAEQAVRRHPECEALLLCWPPFQDDAAYRALSAFGGDRVIYAGDSRFTAEPRFHELLAQEWTLARQIVLPSWPGLADAIYFYERDDPSALRSP